MSTDPPAPIDAEPEALDEARDDAHAEAAVAARRFACVKCGADLAYVPGSEVNRCGHCGHENEIDAVETIVEELGFHETLARLDAEAPTVEVRTARCEGCGAETDRPEHFDAFHCPYCGLAMVDGSAAARVIKPGALLPFNISRDQAQAGFRRWISRRWFAPGDLTRFARTEGRLDGVYVPYWTYDCRSRTTYTGLRGRHYWVTVRGANGKTRRVRKTRWLPAAGTVPDAFDDILILASRALPEKYARRLEPWDLANLTSFEAKYLAGFRAQKHQVELDEGFDVAREIMAPTIRGTIQRDIGGDAQRILSMSTRYDDITYKHVLLPVWISAYRYRERVYRILVNARTGEIQGERPWSVWKIAMAVAAGLLAAAVVAIIAAR